jgi:hypothetical protein
MTANMKLNRKYTTKVYYNSPVKKKFLICLAIVLATFFGQLQAQTITISSSGDTGTSGTNWTTSGSNPVTIEASGDATINTSVITSYLNAGTSVILSTALDIRLSAAISKSSGNSATLTCNAGRDIYLQADISSNSNALTLVLNADDDNNAIGAITLTSNLNSNGGHITFKDDITINGSSAQTIHALSGNIKFEGEVMLGNPSGLTITTGNADVIFSKAINSGNSYALDNTTRTWSQAYSLYNGSNQYLATITSKMELTAAMSVVPAGGAWLGGSDQETEGVWKWVTGPEAGRVFWTTAEPQGARGYTGTNGSFVNWNDGEPNDVNGEDALQIRNNTDGWWNDLPTGSSLLTSVVETELPPSPLTIIAGTTVGLVSFNGEVGTGKPLKNLDVTAKVIYINGGKVITDSQSGEGGQNYTGNVYLSNANTSLVMLDTPTPFTLPAGKSINNASNGNATLTIKTTATILLDTGSSILSSSSHGKLNVILWSDTDANGGYFRMNAGSQITTNGGHIWIGGGSGSQNWNGLTVGNGYALGDGGNSNGILINGGWIITSGGDIAMLGKSRAGDATGSDGVATNVNVNGIRISPYVVSDINSGTGSILMEGISQGTNQVALGVEFCSLQPSVLHSITSAATTGDAITIRGTGSLAIGSQVNTNGVFVHSGTTISATGGGNIKIIGTGGSSGTTASNHFAADAQINAGSGNLIISGNTIYSAGSFSGSGGLNLQPETAGTSIGIGGGTGTLQIPSSCFSSNFTDGFNNITIGSGTAGNITIAGTISINDPLTLKTADNIITASGSSLTGSPEANASMVFWADADGNNGGAIFIQTGTSINSNGGNVTLSGGIDYNSGYARGTSVTNWSGVRLDGNIQSGTGTVSLRGEIGAIPSNQNQLSPGGIFLFPPGSITTTSGNITLSGYVSTNVGTGNALRAIRMGDGITSNGQASLITTSGNIMITGTTVPSYAGAGILFDSSKIQSNSGNITVTGQTGSGEPDLLFHSGTAPKNISNQLISTTGKITLNADLMEVWGDSSLYDNLTISGGGELIFQSRTATTTIGIAGGTGTLQLPASLFTKSFSDGFSRITIGSPAQSGNISLNSISFRDNMRLQTSGKVVVNSNHDIGVPHGVKLQLDADTEMKTGSKIVVN